MQTTLKPGTYTIRNTGTGDQLMCLHADELIALSSIPVVPPTAGQVRKAPELLVFAVCSRISQWVVYLLTGSASVFSMYNRNSSGFAVPDGDVCRPSLQC